MKKQLFTLTIIGTAAITNSSSVMAFQNLSPLISTSLPPQPIQPIAPPVRPTNPTPVEPLPTQPFVQPVNLTPLGPLATPVQPTNPISVEPLPTQPSVNLTPLGPLATPVRPTNPTLVGPLPTQPLVQPVNLTPLGPLATPVQPTNPTPVEPLPTQPSVNLTPLGPLATPVRPTNPTLVEPLPIIKMVPSDTTLINSTQPILQPSNNDKEETTAIPQNTTTENNQPTASPKGISPEPPINNGGTTSYEVPKNITTENSQPTPVPPKPEDTSQTPPPSPEPPAAEGPAYTVPEVKVAETTIPGPKLLIHFKITNPDSQADTYTLSAQDLMGWAIGQLPSTIEVPGGESVDLKLEVTLPPTGNAANVVIITAISKNDPSAIVTTQVPLTVTDKQTKGAMIETTSVEDDYCGTPPRPWPPGPKSLCKPEEIVALKPEEVPALTSEEIATIPPAAVGSFNSQQIANLSPEAVSGFTPEQVTHLTTEAVTGFTAYQLMNLQPEVKVAFSAEQRGKMVSFIFPEGAFFGGQVCFDAGRYCAARFVASCAVVEPCGVEPRCSDIGGISCLDNIASIVTNPAINLNDVNTLEIIGKLIKEKIGTLTSSNGSTTSIPAEEGCFQQCFPVFPPLCPSNCPMMNNCPGVSNCLDTNSGDLKGKVLPADTLSRISTAVSNAKTLGELLNTLGQEVNNLSTELQAGELQAGNLSPTK